MTHEENTLTLSVEAAAAMLGISRGAAYAAVASGQLPSIRIGKRILISKAALKQMLEPAKLADSPE